MLSCTRWRLTERQIWPLVKEGAPGAGRRGGLDVGVVEHDERAVAAQLERRGA